MDEKEIISIIENEFNDLSINNLINELKKIPQYDYKSINTFILKLFRDIDTATKNLKNRFKKYFQNLKSQNSQIIKKIYFQSRNKPLISIYNTKDSTNMKDVFYSADEYSQDGGVLVDGSCCHQYGWSCQEHLAQLR